jgi:carbamoyltransferase
MPLRVIGLSALYHDAAAAVVVDGEIIAAAQEERFTRKKHDASFPRHALDYCLREAGIALSEVDLIAFYDKPLLKFERLLETYLAFAPRGFESFRMAVPIWLREKLFLKDLIQKQLKREMPDFDWEKRLVFSEHHLSHAASAFFPSPYKSAAVLTLDGVGEWATCSLALGQGSHLEIVKELNFPHSLGLLYSAFTYYTGFKVNSGEYKLMGLAPYGEPRFASLILDKLIDLKEDGSFRLDLDYFNYCVGLTMTNQRFEELFGQPARTPEQVLTQFHMDIAASVQKVTEEVMLRMTRDIAAKTGMRNLCLAGGVALNCVANGKILRDGKFDNIWIQPAAGDAGGSIGAALCAYHLFQDKPRRDHQAMDGMKGAYLGPSYAQEEIEQRLRAAGASFGVLDPSAVVAVTADALAEQKAIGWFQGRMEFGPRSLGNRSILGDPKSPSMQKTLNLKVKYRESFRPFAPAVLRECVDDWFDLNQDSPYMLLVADVKKERQLQMSREQQSLFGIDKLNVPRSQIPAVTHVDYSARVQTVHEETNPMFHALLGAFKERTGCPVLVNTSFNVRGEPIVCTPEDAFRCFMGSEIDLLVVGNCVLEKEKQNPDLKLNYENAFAPD